MPWIAIKDSLTKIYSSKNSHLSILQNAIIWKNIEILFIFNWNWNKQSNNPPRTNEQNQKQKPHQNQTTKPEIQFLLSNAKTAMWNPSNLFNLISWQCKDGSRNTARVLNDDRTYRQNNLLSLYHLHLSCIPSYLPLWSPSASPALHQTSLTPLGNWSVIITSI